MNAIRELAPADRGRLGRWLERQGLAWDPGRSFAVEDGASITAAAILHEPSPGDGYHREHVRELALAGDAGGMIAAACAAARAWDGRIEAAISSSALWSREAFAAAGLAREVLLRSGLRLGEAFVDLELWGRDPAGARAAPDEACVMAVRAPESGGERARARIAEAGAVRLAWHDGATRGPLAAFASALVPGRSYPPGTLLSEAERLETSVGSGLRADWILAMAQDDRVVGGIVFARDPGSRHEGSRDHARRVHLDVLPPWQGRGIAASMLRLALHEARARLGASVLEADPRAGNAAACRALERAGFELAGIQPGSWRMRRGGRRWDEDVRFYRADCAP